MITRSSAAGRRAHIRGRRPATDPSRTIFNVAVGLIAVHVVDDSFMQPQPGTSAGDHVFSGLIPLAILGLAAWAYPRVRGGEDDSGHRNPDYYRAAKEPKQIFD